MVSAQAEHFNSKPQIPALLHVHSRRWRNNLGGVGLADGCYLEPLLEAEMSSGTRGVDLKIATSKMHQSRSGLNRSCESYHMQANHTAKCCRFEKFPVEIHFFPGGGFEESQ